MSPSSAARFITERRPLKLAFAALLLVWSLSVFAQSGIETMGTGGAHSIQGRIYFPSGRRADAHIKVRLESTNAGELSTVADMNGSFVFRNLESGSYSIVVESNDYETARETVLIERTKGKIMRAVDANPRSFVIPFYLQLKRTVPAAKSGVVNAALANVPAAAVDLYNRGLAAAKLGNYAKAIVDLKDAVYRYPEFTQALNELGVLYLKLGQPGNAVGALRRALTIEPEALVPRLNYGIALLQNKNFAEAEAQLRQTLKKDDRLATGHLYLGIALINLRNYEEAEKHLQRATLLGRDNMSLAHYYLGGIYWKKKEYKLAADELETYLKLAPNAPDAERIRATIKDMRGKA